MKLKFLGGADVVGRLGMLLNNKGANLLFEYGMKPIKPPEYRSRPLRWRPLS